MLVYLPARQLHVLEEDPALAPIEVLLVIFTAAELEAYTFARPPLSTSVRGFAEGHFPVAYTLRDYAAAWETGNPQGVCMAAQRRRVPDRRRR